VIRQLLKHAKLWYRFAEEYRPLKNTKPPAGQALTNEAQARLFDVAKSKPAWIFAYVAATLDFFCGLRACEIKALQGKHISFEERRLFVRRSKTPTGWRDPSLNEACLDALRELHTRAAELGFTEPEHFLFVWHGRDKKLDPSRPMSSWRTAWRSFARGCWAHSCPISRRTPHCSNKARRERCCGLGHPCTLRACVARDDGDPQ